MRSLLIALLPLACVSRSVGVLPEMVVLTARMEDGSAVSAMITLPRPGLEPTVYLAPGIVAAGPGWALSATPQADGLHLRGPQLAPTTISATAPVVRVDEQGIVLGDGERFERVGLDGQRAPAVAPTEPGGRQRWRGPFDGFAVVEEGGQLSLLLPRSEGVGTPILHGVDSLLGSWWLRSADLPEWEQAFLRENFRQVDVFTVDGGGARIDGDVREWRRSPAVAVDDASQVIAGHSAWTSERDASFGGALRVERGQARMAIRIRDDDFLPGTDQLLVTVDGREAEIYIPARGAPPEEGDGWQAAFSWRGYNSVIVEVGIDAEAPERWGVAPVMVAYHDADIGEEVATISSAPWPELIAVAGKATAE